MEEKSNRSSDKLKKREMHISSRRTSSIFNGMVSKNRNSNNKGMVTDILNFDEVEDGVNKDEEIFNGDDYLQKNLVRFSNMSDGFEKIKEVLSNLPDDVEQNKLIDKFNKLQISRDDYKNKYEESLIKLGKANEIIESYKYCLKVIEENHKQWEEGLEIINKKSIITGNIPKAFKIILNGDLKWIELAKEKEKNLNDQQ